MPAPTPEMQKADAAAAWRDWSRNAPLDLLDFFQDGRAEMHHGPAGPTNQHDVELHAETTEDGGFRVILAFDPLDRESDD